MNKYTDECKTTRAFYLSARLREIGIEVSATFNGSSSPNGKNTYSESYTATVADWLFTWGHADGFDTTARGYRSGDEKLIEFDSYKKAFEFVERCK